MSRLDIKVHQELLRESKKYLKDIQSLDDISFEQKKGGIELTEEHIFEWLQVFYDDRIMLDGCNHATVKR
jgi:hypothetical protein